MTLSTGKIAKLADGAVVVEVSRFRLIYNKYYAYSKGILFHTNS